MTVKCDVHNCKRDSVALAFVTEELSDSSRNRRELCAVHLRQNVELISTRRDGFLPDLDMKAVDVYYVSGNRPNSRWKAHVRGQTTAWGVGRNEHDAFDQAVRTAESHDLTGPWKMVRIRALDKKDDGPPIDLLATNRQRSIGRSR